MRNLTVSTNAIIDNKNKLVSRTGISAREEILRYKKTIVETISKYIRQKHNREDIFQECYIKLLLKFDKYNGDGSFDGWVRRVVSNTCLDYLRWQTNQRITYVESENIKAPTYDITPLHLLEADDTHKIINSLPKKSKEVMQLYVYDGFNHKEISSTLGIKESSSRSQLVRARKAVKEKIEAQEIIFV
jgi:RNA polymerase sigma-70 factor (ECF subfamily)